MFVLLVILASCVSWTHNAALTNLELKKYKNLIEGQGLYKADEDVYVLTAHNIKKQLYGKPHANLVEFYNSWCGFCQRFQPTWSALATDIRSWKDRVVISAIDCSDDDNAPICSGFEIMAYPTLRYFHENYIEESGKIGVEVVKGVDMQTHKIALLKQIVVEQTEGRAKMLASIVPYQFGNVSHVYDGVGDDTRFVFFINEPAEMLGAEIAIALQNTPAVAVKYTLSNNTEISRYAKVGVTVFTNKPREKPVLLDVAEPHSRENVLAAIKMFLIPHSIILAAAQTAQRAVFTGKWNDVQVPNSDDLQKAREKLALRLKVKKMGDVVFQADLETALRHSLRREIPMSRTITGEKHAALQKYLSVLVKYFPFGPKGREFLRKLLADVESSSELAGATFASWVRSVETQDAQVFSSLPQWLACEGSTPTSRGYPCGLWKLFHYLSVSATESDNGQANATEVLDAMLGYIKYFFGCSDCSQHFQQMAEEKDMKGVNSLDSAVLWLWMAHNSANKRLAGDDTEDPEYPKIQFPSSENCPTCRKDSTWDLSEVLRYIKTVYASINVRYIGSDTRILHMGLESNSNIHNSSSTSLLQQLDTTTPLYQKDLRS